MPRNAVAVFPTGGWWRENPAKGRANQEIRYSLVATLRTVEDVNLYTPIATPVAAPVVRRERQEAKLDGRGRCHIADLFRPSGRPQALLARRYRRCAGHNVDGRRASRSAGRQPLRQRVAAATAGRLLFSRPGATCSAEGGQYPRRPECRFPRANNMVRSELPMRDRHQCDERLVLHLPCRTCHPARRMGPPWTTYSLLEHSGGNRVVCNALAPRFHASRCSRRDSRRTKAACLSHPIDDDIQFCSSASSPSSLASPAAISPASSFSFDNSLASSSAWKLVRSRSVSKPKWGKEGFRCHVSSLQSCSAAP